MKTTFKLILSAMFLALGLTLPFLTGQIPQIGNLLLPMHIPVFLCAFICGWQYGGIVGFITPLLRCFIFGVPFLYPNAISMAFELCTYAIVCGLIYHYFKKKNIFSIYCSMLPAMVLGRVVWGVMQVILLGIKDITFSFSMFISGAILNAIPGIIIQLILIPAIVTALQYSHVLDGRRICE